MLVAKMFLMILFFAMSVASEGTNYSYPLRVLRSSDDTMQEEVEYFEQCGFVNLWKEHLGRVSVLTFLDPTWQYSFRQAVMLKLLSSRLRKSGFPDIRFFVIAPLHDLTEDKTEDDDEIETWREIAAMFGEDPDINDFLTTKDNEPEIIYLEDEFRIWERFRASKNQVVIIDRCGQLTYHVMVPWSILYFPYVKAAILSTYKEDPCGGCDPTKYQALNHEDYFSDLKSTTLKKVDPLEIDDNIDTDLFWTTEQSSKNDSILEESLTDKNETNTISPIISDKITHDSDDPLKFFNMTNASVVSENVTYGYDNVTIESSPDEDPKETSRREDSSTTSEKDATSATLDLQQEVSPTQDESASMSDNSISGEIKNESTTNEVKDEFISTTETTTADIVAEDDEIPDRGKNTEAELSLHVIMRAPHVHGNGRKTRKHTYLMLKIGDPDFHEHPDAGIDATSSTTLWRDTDPQVANSENNDSETTEMNEQNTDRIYTFDKDESPGLYGEIADYWRDNNSDADSNESLDNDTHNNSTTSYNEKHHTNVSGQATTSSESSETDENYSTTNVTTNINNSTNSQNTVRVDKTDSSESISGNNENNKEEMRNNLIKHYNKLLSWIGYRLIR
ncbi:probable serine/threonine-protein kinase DDB_G0282963 [Nylanderia fulva]|uniref:probable serine/threonine-protein kinase DDB_G0282963 n=1 Tax=Nylanderia fulva TaxID=613905 RepID=UPI0010FB1D28|nr:probable serine/threonine-protein kinase DDB_G0282963 [Nylanderia fulva]